MFYSNSIKSFILAVILLPCVACGSYNYHMKRMMRPYVRGDYETALKRLDDWKYRKSDKLLYLLNRGTILHVAGSYKESNKVFESAEDLIELYDKQGAARQVAATVTNDWALRYTGEKFERLLINVFKMLNYAALNEWDEALVEVRRINTNYEDFFKNKDKEYLDNVFAKYFQAMVWKVNGKPNDAYIDLKHIALGGHKIPGLEKELYCLSKKIGMYSDSEMWRKKFNLDKNIKCESAKGEVELIYVLEAGRAPKKVSTEHEADLQVLPVPAYERCPADFVKARVSIGKKSEATYVLEDVAETAEASLKDLMPGIISRAVARLVVKEGAAVAVGKEVDSGLGIALGILMLATNRADTRSWLTLPETMQMARLSVKKRVYDIKVEYLDSNGHARGHDSYEKFNLNRPKLIVKRTF